MARRRSSLVVAALALLGESCGGARAPVTDTSPVAPATSSIIALDAGAFSASSDAAPLSACRAPWDGGKPLSDVPAPGRLGGIDPPASEVAYAHARHEYAAEQWDRAGTDFRAIAFAYPDQEIGIYAAELYLNALAMLNVAANRPSCREEMASEGARLMTLYCDEARRPKNEEGCRRLAAAMDPGPHEIVWSWKGTFDFIESGAACSKDCTRYRIVIEKCPGPCKVHVDVDGPHGSQRLEGTAVGTSDRYVVEVHFEAYRGSPPSPAPFAKGITLFTLEAAPGDHMVLAFAALHSGDGRATVIADHVSLSRAK